MTRKKQTTVGRRAQRTVRFKIDGHEFVSELKPTTSSPARVQESPRLVLWCSATEAVEPTRQRDWYVNVVAAAERPSLKAFAAKGSPRVGHALYQTESVRAEVCVQDVWRVFENVRAGAITHIEVGLEPDNAEFDRLTRFAFAAQPHMDLDLPQRGEDE